MADLDVVLFDLGGVLVDFGGVEPMKALSGVDDDDELWSRWLSCEWVRTFERGGCTPNDFAAGVVDDWELAVAPAEFLDSFRSWVGGPLPGADALVRDTRRATRVGCLSNTNALHWDDQEPRHELLRAFDVRFLSFEIGCVKPDRDAFDQVASALAVPRERILFLDDNTINVEGARAAGFRAERAVGVADARAHLERLEVLPAS
jgi:putative hydrolase of the HAD superfamily